jgi:LacI family transcriptional regulator
MDLGAAIDRLEGYKSALQVHHLSYDSHLVYEGSFFQPDGYAGGSALLVLEYPPTAIFASNDVMAMGAMDAIRSRGLRIPQDVSIIGFDDIPQAAMVRPALTTVRQPLEEMGRMATQMLIDQLKNPEKEFGRIELPTQLIVRDSTLSPKDRAG